MIQSMTGFGNSANKDFSVEIRSLNHRHIDISIKMPPHMLQYEIPLRNILKERFQRGRFDVLVLPATAKAPQLTVNREVAKNIFAALKELQKELSLSGTIGIETLTSFSGILMEEESSSNSDALFTAFHEAVSNLQTMRIREGALITEDLRERIEVLQEMNERIKQLAPDEIVHWREKFTERLRSILEPEMIDPGRIVQEAAITAEKLDISEEMNRIENHLKQFREILSIGISVGKKLDFLLQEINREVNTLSYKSVDYSISSIVVDMKTDIEKIREQVQNIQ
jgi:uncharacterized protein (TIGR00255 family)